LNHRTASKKVPRYLSHSSKHSDHSTNTHSVSRTFQSTVPNTKTSWCSRPQIYTRTF